MDVSDLLDALNLTELESMLKPVPSTDAELAKDLSQLLTDASGYENSEAATELEQMLTDLFDNIAAALGGGPDPVAAALLDAKAGMTYAELLKYTAGELGAATFRPPVMATESAPDVVAYYEQAGEPWAEPDSGIPDDPFGLDDDATPQPIQKASPSWAPPGWETFKMLVPKSLRDFGNEILDGWKSAGDPKSTTEDGPLVHLALQVQYVQWALRQKPPHLVLLDNMIGNVDPKFGFLLDPDAIKEWAKSLVNLADMAPGDPDWDRLAKAQQGLSRGSANRNEFARPDIADATSFEVYEIKPVRQVSQGLRDLFYYLILLNAVTYTSAVFTSVLGQWQKGAGFGPQPGKDFWMPGINWFPQYPVFPMLDGRWVIAATCAPGLVLYEIYDGDQAEDREAKVLAASKAFAAALLLKRILQLKGEAAGEAAQKVAEAMHMSPATQRAVQQAVAAVTLFLLAVGMVAPAGGVILAG